MLLLKMNTMEFEFERHLGHMVSYQGMQSQLPEFLAGINSMIFVQDDCLAKPDFSSEHQNWIIFGQNMIISSHLLITNQLEFDSGLLIKLKTKHIVEKENFP